MTEAKRRKCMDIAEGGRRYICIHDRTAKWNPYKVYEAAWHDGGYHRKKVEEYANFASVIYWLAERAKETPEWFRD